MKRFLEKDFYACNLLKLLGNAARERPPSSDLLIFA